MEGAIIFRWGSPRAGFEEQALKLFADVEAFYSRLQREGKITYHEAFIYKTGSIADELGFTLVKGPEESLAAILNSDEGLKLRSESVRYATHFHVDALAIGEEAMRLVASYADVVKEVALVH